jgi:hypothetical protein
MYTAHTTRAGRNYKDVHWPSGIRHLFAPPPFVFDTMWAPAALALAFTSLFLSVSAGSVSAHFVPNVMPTPPRAGGGSTASAGSASAPTDSEPDTLPGARVGGSAHPTEQALIGCSEPFCGGTCTFVALPSVAKNVCTKANAPFASGMVWSPDGSAVQFGVRGMMFS